MSVFEASYFGTNRPGRLEIQNKMVSLKRPSGLFGTEEVSLDVRRIKSIQIKTGLFFCDIAFVWSGGEPLISEGHPKAHAEQVKRAVALERDGE